MPRNESAMTRVTGMLAMGLLVLSAQAASGAPNSGELRQQVERIVDRHAKPLVQQKGSKPSVKQAPGGIVGVYINGETFYFPYGRIDDAGTAPTKDTIFGIGSITKTFTTSILGQRQELFNKSVSEGPLPPGYKLQPEEAPVTFEQLATFTGGIVPSAPQTCGKKNQPVCDQARFVTFINERRPKDGKLPTPDRYSDSSVGFLGQILMYRDGDHDFGAPEATRWFDEHLFSHVGMDHTSHPPKTDSEHRLSDAYAYGKGKYVRVRYAGWVPWGTAGRMFSTAEDMTRFIMANVGVSTIDGRKVPEKILEGMAQALFPRTPLSSQPPLWQAFAWDVWPEDFSTRSRIRGKAGGIDGVSAYVSVNPELQYGVIILLNKDHVYPKDATLDIMKALRPLASTTR